MKHKKQTKGHSEIFTLPLLHLLLQRVEIQKENLSSSTSLVFAALTQDLRLDCGGDPRAHIVDLEWRHQDPRRRNPLDSIQPVFDVPILDHSPNGT